MMRDHRCKYDASTKMRAAELADAGRGWHSISSELALPVSTVRKWVLTYRATGLDGLLRMGSVNRSYDYETRLAAARAHVDQGRTLQDVMTEYGIASASPLHKWCKLYREGGAEALRPRPRGRPAGRAAGPSPKTREQELEERVRRLEAENAYLKKLGALRAEKRLRAGRRPRS